jgi:hypothetical protein
MSMLKRGNGFGFALHALFQFRVVGKMGGQYLDATVRSSRVSLAR